MTISIAVASRDGCTVSGHIGKCADWIVFEVIPSNQPDFEPQIREVDRITLPKKLVFHHYKDDIPHPLDECSAVIGASAGDNFIAKMQRRGIEPVLTAESDPATAVADFIRDTITPARKRPIGSLICKIHDALSSHTK